MLTSLELNFDGLEMQKLKKKKKKEKAQILYFLLTTAKH